IARVRADHTMADAERELSGIHERLEREYRKEYASVGALVVGLQAEITREYTPALVAIAGTVFLMLLIAAANVVNLNLARAVRREQEFAVRIAVGAGRGRITAQLLTEGLV